MTPFQQTNENRMLVPKAIDVLTEEIVKAAELKQRQYYAKLEKRVAKLEKAVDALQKK